MRRALGLSFAACVLVIAPSAFADPTVQQCIASNEHSIQLQNEHKLRQARVDLLECAAAACPAEIRTECERRLAVVTNDIPTVVLSAKDGHGVDLVDVRAYVDDALATQKLDGVPIQLDPGPHAFRFVAPFQPPVEERVVIHEGEKNRAIRVMIGKPEPIETPASPRRRDPTMRVAGITTASVGLAGVVLGSIFGGLASAAWSRSRDECTSPSVCANYTKAIADHDDAVTFATVSTIAFIAGGVAVAAGAVLFFAAPLVKPTSVGMTFGARF